MKKGKNWPNSKNEREQLEIGMFISACRQHTPPIDLKVLQRRDKPDYLVECNKNGSKYYVELTACYIDDDSVDVLHRVEPGIRPYPIPYDEDRIFKCKGRLREQIDNKIRKAKQGYDNEYPIILAIYLNEYDGIYINFADYVQSLCSFADGTEQIDPFVNIALVKESNSICFLKNINSTLC